MSDPNNAYANSRGHRIIGEGYLGTSEKNLASLARHYRAKARLKMGELIIPSPPRNAKGERIEEKAPEGEETPQIVDPALKQEGWVYAEGQYKDTTGGMGWTQLRSNISDGDE